MCLTSVHASFRPVCISGVQKPGLIPESEWSKFACSEWDNPPQTKMCWNTKPSPSKQPRVVHMDINISVLPNELSPILRAELAEVFFLHCLYMRSQLPIPFSQMRIKAQAQTRVQTIEDLSRASSSVMRASAFRTLQEFVGEMEALLKAVQNVFLTAVTAPDTLYLILGTSATCPTEVFCLRFPSAIGCPASSAGAAQEPSTDVLRRRVIRELVSQWAGGEGSPRPLGIFIAVQVPDSKNISQCAGELFRVADVFCPRARRRCPPVVCRLQEAEQARRADAGQAEQQQEQWKWYISRRAVRPLKTRDI